MLYQYPDLLWLERGITVSSNSPIAPLSQHIRYITGKPIERAERAQKSLIDLDQAQNVEPAIEYLKPLVRRLRARIVMIRLIRLSAGLEI